MSALSGGVFAAESSDGLDELRSLVADLGTRSVQARVGQRRLPEEFDAAAWANLEETGLSRLTTTPELEAGPGEAAVVLRGLAYHAVAAPIAETDVLAAWLARTAGVGVPGAGPLTVAVGPAVRDGDRLRGTAGDVPWTRAAGRVVLVASTDDAILVGSASPGDLDVVDGYNVAGEPRDGVSYALAVDDFRPIGAAVLGEFTRRGAWARCVQCIGALDRAAELSVAHVRERVQFGRPLSRFQAVQHSLAQMAGEIERGRAATTLAVAAASDHGFASPQADYAVTMAKVVLGRVVPGVATAAHQLHGAIGVTIEHALWSATNRAHSWIDEFGGTDRYARRLGRVALSRSGAPLWDVLTGTDTGGFA
ncbi:acyl-CoA dehydrogenase family protein [Mycolicibacterium palauense]|uniref:acyl-CoA dehydrogenase family protein n=1 Tax=Mycolicibacterium palauense TaxID=2034511 RepID=UPI000BFF191D|nr:acyl-CoA dehydrogenase family protein [Mycolicibacterium palauense]